MGFLSGILGTSNDSVIRKPVNQFQATSPAEAGTISTANTQASGGAGPASGTIARQSLLSDQLQAAANGQGPNPALEQLKQTTQNNINSAAGQVASARGINPALAARMAVDSAGGANQQAAGQAATLSAEQQIAARDALARNLAATGSAQLGQQATGVQALGTAGGLNLGAQGLNANVASQNANLDLESQKAQAGIAGQNAQTNAGLVGGLMNGVGGYLGLAEGGVVPKAGGPLSEYLASLHGLADGGAVKPEAEEKPAENVKRPLPANSSPSIYDAKAKIGGHNAQLDAALNGEGMAHGGKVPVRLSPQEVVVPPTLAKRPDAAARYVASGAGKVPGKAKVEGDSPKNDTVSATLTPGSVVIPRHITQGPNAAERSASFVASVLKRSGGRAMANGGFVAEGASPGPAARVGSHNYADGGLVGSDPKTTKKPEGSTHTGRGLAREETRRRLSSSSAPKYREAD